VADERVVSVKLKQVEQFHGELREKKETLSRDEFLESTTEQRAVERMFENTIQACSDLANHIATDDFGFNGSSSKEALRVLSQENVIDERTMTTLVLRLVSEMSLHTNTGTSIPAKSTKRSRLDSGYMMRIVDRLHSGSETESVRGN